MAIVKNSNSASNDPLHRHNRSFAEQTPVPPRIESLLQRYQHVLLRDLLTCVCWYK
jgi:hypothetical protein